MGLEGSGACGAVGIGTGCFPVFPKVDTPYGQALTGLRVQAPFGARVLWSVCCAPDHGFSPQSGLVQRGVLYAAWGSENHTTALTGEEMKSPFGGWRHHLAPVGSMSLDSRVAALPYESSSFATPAKAVGLWVLSNGAMSLQKSMEPFILSPGWGKVRRSRIRGGAAQRLITRMLFMTYDADRLIRNADFISIAR